jgi:hypothetical protein
VLASKSHTPLQTRTSRVAVRSPKITKLGESPNQAEIGGLQSFRAVGVAAAALHAGGRRYKVEFVFYFRHYLTQESLLIVVKCFLVEIRN